MSMGIEVIRKAGEFFDIEDLRLSRGTVSVVKKLFSSASEAILFGRRAAFSRDKSIMAPWCKELVEKLDDLGLIRHEFDQVTLNFYEMYSYLVNSDYRNPKRGVLNPYLLSNGLYEYLEGFSNVQKTKVRAHLIERLGEPGGAFVIYRWGLQYGETHSFEEAVEAYVATAIKGLDDTKIAVIRGSAKVKFENIEKRFRNNYVIKKFLANTLFPYDIHTNMGRVKELVYLPERNSWQVAELMTISLLPYESSRTARRFLENNKEYPDLKLSKRVYNFLIDEELYTVADILSVNDLSSFDGIGKKTAAEILNITNLAMFKYA